MTPRIGSVCTGYGGLDMAVQEVSGGELAWVADPDPGAAAILTHHHPDVPNLGDITVTDWAAVEPVDIVCGGYPCQPFSVAGLRKGTADERHLWPFIASALGVLRPRLAIFENVQGHLRLGFDTVLADLARLGFDAEWCLVRASEVGAPHRRSRLLFLAWPADTARPGLPWPGVRGRVAERGNDAPQDADRAARDQRRLAASGQAESRGARADARGRGGAPAADADRDSLRQQPVAQPGRRSAAVAELPGTPAADSDGGGQRPILRNVLPGQSNAPRSAAAHAAGDCDPHGPVGDHRIVQLAQPGAGGGDRPGDCAEGTGGDHPAGVLAWGRFAPAIAWWEHTTGRPAPRATDARNRLNPLFVEWLMGLPAGHVTAVPGLSRTQQLKALGNGVVPQQATAALRLLLDRAEAAA